VATVPSQQTVVVGGKITAAYGNDDIRDAINFLLDPPRCSLYMSAADSIANNTWEMLSWDSESWDNDSMHSTSSNTSRLTFPTAGRYLIVVNALFDANGTGGRAINLTKNGAGARSSSNVVLSDGGVAATATAATRVAVTIEREFAAADYVEAWVWQSSGGALNCTGGTNGTTISARRVSS
jgi:hypothetical protein